MNMSYLLAILIMAYSACILCDDRKNGESSLTGVIGYSGFGLVLGILLGAIR